MSALSFCSGRRVEAAVVTSLPGISHNLHRTAHRSQLRRNPSHPKAPFVKPPRLLNMPKLPRSQPSEHDIQTMAQTLQAVQVSEVVTASAGPQTAISARKQPTPANSKTQSAREVRDEKVAPSRASGGIPTPTAAYFAASNALPQLLPQPQHLLVVIDLNGTLLYRPSKKQATKFVARPNTAPFLQYCVDTFSVVIWSSARPENVTNMCNAILTPPLRKKVIAIWGRDKFGLSRQDFELRVQCYKRLTTLWNDRSIARSHPEHAYGGRWDQTNTVLVDDSLEKGRSEPFNLIEVPEFFGNANEQGRILPQVHDYLNHLSMHSNVSACLRARPFKHQVSS